MQYQLEHSFTVMLQEQVQDYRQNSYSQASPSIWQLHIAFVKRTMINWNSIAVEMEGCKYWGRITCGNILCVHMREPRANTYDSQRQMVQYQSVVGDIIGCFQQYCDRSGNCTQLPHTTETLSQHIIYMSSFTPAKVYTQRCNQCINRLLIGSQWSKQAIFLHTYIRRALYILLQFQFCVCTSTRQQCIRVAFHQHLQCQ